MDRTPPLLDMTPDGRFRPQPRRPGVPLSFRILVAAVVVAAVAFAASIAAFAISVLAVLLPVAAGAAVVAWATLRYRRWQRRRAAPRAVVPGQGPFQRPPF